MAVMQYKGLIVLACLIAIIVCLITLIVSIAKKKVKGIIWSLIIGLIALFLMLGVGFGTSLGIF